jgi:hypothetical protein
MACGGSEATATAAAALVVNVTVTVTVAAPSAAEVATATALCLPAVGLDTHVVAATVLGNSHVGADHHPRGTHVVAVACPHGGKVASGTVGPDRPCRHGTPHVAATWTVMETVGDAVANASANASGVSIWTVTVTASASVVLIWIAIASVRWFRV